MSIDGPDLADLIVAELTDPRFINRTHGRRSGVNAGCTGPLCQKFNRDRLRERYQRTKPNARRVRPGAKNPERDEFLDRIIEGHVESKRLSRVS